jgi:hypothetical protein
MKHIEEYLASIGFKTDGASFKEAEKRLDEMGQKVDQLAEKINNSGAPKKLNGMLEAFSKGFLENPKVQQGMVKIGKQVEGISEKLVSGASQAGGAIASFLTTTGGTVAITTAGILAAIAAIAAAMTALGVLATSIIHKFMADMASADMEVQKFARRMFTTVENARSLKAVMKQMGLDDIDDLKDVSVNPELRKQFFELRAMASGMALDKSTQKGFQNIRRLEFAFQKMSLSLDYFFATLAGKMGDSLGPLLDKLVTVMDAVTDFIAQNLGPLTNTLSQIIGLVARLVTLAMQLMGLMGWVDPQAIKDLGTILSFALSGLNQALDRFIKIFDFINKVKGGGLGGDKYGKQESLMERLARYSQGIYDILSRAWQWLQSLLRDLKDKALGIGRGLGAVAGIAAKAGAFGPLAQSIANLAPAPGGGGKVKYRKGIKLNENLKNFIASLESRMPGGFTASSGVASRSGSSNHPRGRAVDLIPDNKSIKGWADLVQGILATPGGQRANIELTSANYMAVMEELKRRKVDTTRTSRFITSDYTGEHIHADIAKGNITININGAKSPQATADEVMERLKAKRSVVMRNTQGMVQ